MTHDRRSTHKGERQRQSRVDHHKKAGMFHRFFVKPFYRFFPMKEVEDTEEIKVKRRFLFKDKAGDQGRSGRSLARHSDGIEEDINDVVDFDDADTDNLIASRLVPEFVGSPWFRLTSYTIIVLNAVMLGLETEKWFTDNYMKVSEIIKELTTGFFVCEILLKWYSGFWIFWKSNWNIMDFIIVGLAVIGPKLRYWSCGRVLRLLRACLMLRSLESIDKLEILRGLRPIVEALLMSIIDMINIGLLLILILLALAIAANNLLGDALPEYYGDLGASFFSLFVLTTQDGIIIQYKSFEPKSLYIRSVGCIFFVVAIMAGAFIFINIIVGISCYNLDVATKEMEGDDDDSSSDDDSENERDLLDETSDDPAGELLEKLRILSMSKSLKGLNLIHLQKPYQMADFSNVSLAKLEKYFMVLSALEENLAEYQDIRKDFEEIYELVKNLNLIDIQPVSSDTNLRSGSSISLQNKMRAGSKPQLHRHFEEMLRRGAMRVQGVPEKPPKGEGSLTPSVSSGSVTSTGSRKLLSPSAALGRPSH